MYIFCESYGGKMGLGLAQAILQAQQAGKLDVNLRYKGDVCVCVGGWGRVVQACAVVAIIVGVGIVLVFIFAVVPSSSYYYSMVLLLFLAHC